MDWPKVIIWILLMALSLACWVAFIYALKSIPPITFLEHAGAGAPAAIGENEYGREKCKLAPRSRGCVRWCVDRGGCFDLKR